MKRASVVVVVLLLSVFWTLPTADASGSYGAVVEKGVRGCTTDHETGIVICFESPSVNSESRRVFLRLWPAASPHVGWGDAAAAMMRVRSVSVTVGPPDAGRPVIAYVARADRVLPLLGCSDGFRFRESDGAIRLQSFVSDCKPR
ncbi:MAG TPA: hypothetical protein VLA55_10280, partial [Ornithinibacter sp.]|nr:hypothetical protein [Ornithinibacter sp.]